jgi:hypothetical protein
LHLSINKDVLDKFRQLVSEKYEGYAKGQLSMEVEQAPVLARNTQTGHAISSFKRRCESKPRSAPKAARLKHQIYTYFKEAKGIEDPTP